MAGSDSPRSRRTGSSDSARDPPTRSAAYRLPPWLRENLDQSLPILVAGGFCIGLAAWFDAAHLHAFGSRMPLWTLVAAVGGTLVGGGSALTLVEEPIEPVPGVPEGYLLVLQSDWDRLTQPAATQGGEAEPPPEPWEEGPAETSDVESALARLTVDPEAVARASADLVAPPPPSVPDTLVGALAARAAGAHTRPAPTLPAPPSPAPSPPPSPRFDAPTPGPAGSQVPLPVATEFQSVLSLLERAEASVRSRIAPPQISGQPRDRCTGCGASVSTYSEQICVMCDRPLCDRCVDRTAEAGHPQMCDTCHAKLPE